MASRRPTNTLLAALFSAPLLWACSSSEDEVPPAHPRIKLVDVAAARLDTARPIDGKRVFGEPFAEPKGWQLVSTPTNPKVHTEGAIAHQLLKEDKIPYLRLGGKRGLYVKLVEVRGNTCYTFSGNLRTQRLVPSSTPFHGATYWLAELKTDAPFEEIVQGDFEGAILQRHILPNAVGEADWVARTKTFRTKPGTKALLIGCALGTSEDVESGTVEFSQLHLFEAPDRNLWNEMALEAARSRSGPKHDDWRGQRLIPADLRAELRPSIVLLPRESLTFELRLQEDAPIFEAGLGVWRPAIVPGSTPTAKFELSIDGLAVHTQTLVSPRDALANRWDEMRVGLGTWANKTVEVNLRCEGEVPLVLGAPCVRSANQVAERPNVLLISIDMLRADHVSAYGYEHKTTPHLDRMAEENLFFPNMHAQAAYTLPATVSLFAGQFPSVHGVYRGTQAVSPERSPLLAEILGAEGYRTQAFTAGGFVSADFGLDAGFDGFTNVDPLRHNDSDFFHLLRDRNPELTKELVAEHGPERISNWLVTHHEEPFFLFVHTYTVHDYDPPEGWFPCDEFGCKSNRTDYTNFLPHIHSNETITEEDREHLYHRYDGALRYVDSLLDEIFELMKTLGLWDNTIVVVTSDHGEEMFERGVIQHGKTLYEEMTRIPLIMRVPGQGPRVIHKPVMTIDIAPTVLRALGLPVDERMQGSDVLAQDLETRAVIAEIDDNFAHKFMLRDGQGFKLIHSPREREDVLFPGEKEWELYSTADDPDELKDLAPTEKERFEQLKAALAERIQLLKELGESLGGVGSSEVSENTRKQLDALGY